MFCLILNYKFSILHLAKTLLSNYLKYYSKAKTKYQVHSPFVFDFVENIVEDDRYYYAFDTIEAQRKNLLLNKKKLQGENGEIVLKKLLEKAISKSEGRLLFKIINLYKPEQILALGTSLYISALYLAAPNSKSKVTALEPYPQMSLLARKYPALNLKNLEILTGSYDVNLHSATKETNLNLVYFDPSFPTSELITYFEKSMAYALPNSIFVIGRPYANEERAASWSNIKMHAKVKLTIDLYQLGIVFFRAEQKEVAHFALISAWKKPWAIY